MLLNVYLSVKQIDQLYHLIHSQPRITDQSSIEIIRYTDQGVGKGHRIDINGKEWIWDNSEAVWKPF